MSSSETLARILWSKKDLVHAQERQIAAFSADMDEQELEDFNESIQHLAPVMEEQYDGYVQALDKAIQEIYSADEIHDLLMFYSDHPWAAAKQNEVSLAMMDYGIKTMLPKVMETMSDIDE